MIAERIQQSYTSAKYYQFATILEHVIDCFHTIVSDETNPYHPPLAWLTRKQPKPPDDELFLDLMDECSRMTCGAESSLPSNDNGTLLSASVRTRLERCSHELKQEIVSRTKDGCSPLFIACKNGLTKVAEYLIDVCNAEIEQRGRYEALEDHHIHYVSPIWVASISGHLETVKLLINRGANVNSLSDTGSTPLRSVCFLCKDDDDGSAQHYIREGDMFLPDYFASETSDSYMEIVKLLVENGADVGKSNYNGGTCLINSLHNYRLTEYILDHGANINDTDNQSKTALHYAIQQGRLEVAQLLIARGADPFLRANSCDDALQLCCIGGHVEIFEFLIRRFHYSYERLTDAYKLLGSSILEIHYDLSRVRKLWEKSLEMQRRVGSSRSNQYPTGQEESNSLQANEFDDQSNCCQVSGREECDIRRSIAYGDIIEFTSEPELQALSVEDFRIQSLIISERILGSDHRETIQRLLYRGTFYIHALNPGRCIDLWVYALKLRLKYDSIFHFESIFAAQAITKLFLDLFSQHQQHQIKFRDVYDVLSLLVEKLDNCKLHLSWKPVSYLHSDIFDLLLGIIVNLLLALKCIAGKSDEMIQQTNQIISQIVRKNPRSSNGSSLLHICIAPGVFDGEAYRSLSMTQAPLESSRDSGNVGQNTAGQLEKARNSPVVELIMTLIDNGLSIDQANDEGLSALQVLCLTASIRATDKRKVIRLLVERGAHVDRRTVTPEQGESIRQALREAGVNPFNYVSLACLASRKVSELRTKFDEKILTRNLRESIAIH